MIECAARTNDGSLLRAPVPVTRRRQVLAHRAPDGDFTGAQMPGDELALMINGNAGVGGVQLRRRRPVSSSSKGPAPKSTWATSAAVNTNGTVRIQARQELDRTVLWQPLKGKVCRKIKALDNP